VIPGWLGFMDDDLEYFDLDGRVLEPLDRHLGPCGHTSRTSCDPGVRAGSRIFGGALKDVPYGPPDTTAV
jgi:hypothetical protein